MKFKSEIRHVPEGVQGEFKWQVKKDEQGNSFKVYEDETLEEAIAKHKIAKAVEINFEVVEDEIKPKDSIRSIVNEIPEEVNEIKAEIIDDAISRFLEK
jgi:hypothetical protein